MDRVAPGRSLQAARRIRKRVRKQRRSSSKYYYIAHLQLCIVPPLQVYGSPASCKKPQKSEETKEVMFLYLYIHLYIYIYICIYISCGLYRPWQVYESPASCKTKLQKIEETEEDQLLQCCEIENWNCTYFVIISIYFTISVRFEVLQATRRSRVRVRKQRLVLQD